MNLKSVTKIIRENLILVGKSIAKFYRENKVLVIILLIAIIIILKFSKIEYIIGTPKIIQSIFNAPNYEGSLYEILRIGENLSLAYIMTLIFYILKEYIPNENKSRKSYNIVKSNVIELNRYIWDLIDSVNLLLDKENMEFELIKNNHSIMDGIEINNNKCYFKSRDVNKCNIRFEEYEWNYIIFNNELPGKINNIVKKIEELVNIPAFMGCNYKLINTISKLKSNKFLNKLKESINNISIYGKPGVYGLGREFIVFVEIYEELNILTECKDKRISELMDSVEEAEYIEWLADLKAKNIINFSNVKGIAMFQNKRIN